MPYLHFLLLCLWGTHVRIFDHFHDVHSIVFSVGQALANEILGLCRYGRLIRKLDFGGLQNNVFFKDSGLRLIVAEWLKKEFNFKEKIWSNRLKSKLPFCRKDIGRKWHRATKRQLLKRFLAVFCPPQSILVASTSRFLLLATSNPCHGLDCNFQNPWFWIDRNPWFWCHRSRSRRSAEYFLEINCWKSQCFKAKNQRIFTWFEIIMNDGWFDFVQVLESRRDLHHNRSRFTLRNGFMLKWNTILFCIF